MEPLGFEILDTGAAAVFFLWQESSDKQCPLPLETGTKSHVLPLLSRGFPTHCVLGGHFLFTNTHVLV